MCFPFQFMTVSLSTEHLPLTYSQLGWLLSCLLYPQSFPAVVHFLEMPCSQLQQHVSAMKAQTHVLHVCYLLTTSKKWWVCLFFFLCCNFLVKIIDNEVLAQRNFTQILPVWQEPLKGFLQKNFLHTLNPDKVDKEFLLPRP